jgi:class 3 adenylate cyclase
MNSASVATPRKVSRNAVLNYRMRTLGLVMFALMLAIIPVDYPDPLRWFTIGLMLIWPHVLFQIARRASSGYRAESLNILADNFLGGLIFVAFEFRLWPVAGILLLNTLNTVTFGGWRLQLKGIGMIAAGLLVGSLLVGLHAHLETEPPVVAISFLTAYVYILFIGTAIFRVRQGSREAKQAVETEREKSHQLLLKVFPKAVIPRLQAKENPIADEFADVTVLFSDIVGYTPLAEELGPKKTVMLLNDLYKRFDQIAAEHGVEKIETVGDGYLAVAGAPVRNDDHPESAAAMALAMIEAAKQVKIANGESVQIRIGLHTGPIFAGVIGEHRFHYAIFGETVNVASRVQGQSRPGGILVSESTYKRLKGSHRLEECGSLELKGHGPMRTYWLSDAKDRKGSVRDDY